MTDPVALIHAVQLGTDKMILSNAERRPFYQWFPDPVLPPSPLYA